MSDAKPILKPAAGQMITGNDIWTGAVVFLKRDGGWTDDPRLAAISESVEDSEHLLALGEAATARAEVELVHRADAAIGADGPFPTRNREVIRALGPTVRPDLGYRAGQRMQPGGDS